VKIKWNNINSYELRSPEFPHIPSASRPKYFTIMDSAFLLHLSVPVLLVSIPFWPIPYLRYGVYIPLIISIVWVLFNGCPATKYHMNSSDDSFTRKLYSYVIPNITKKDASHLNTFVLILITVLGFRRLMRGK
jgi:hypothetical protein